MKIDRFLCLFPLLALGTLFAQSKPLSFASPSGDARMSLNASLGQGNTMVQMSRTPRPSQAGGLNFDNAVIYGSGANYPMSLALRDVNGDGKLDLLVVNQCLDNTCWASSGTVGVLLGNGDGTFQSVVSYDTGGVPSFSVAVGDMNGDGSVLI
ncbi:MAG TPA: VCBS repeat-containing protein [Candidatus Sulfotelmatobacter sp.]